MKYLIPVLTLVAVGGALLLSAPQEPKAKKKGKKVELAHAFVANPGMM